MIKTCPDCNKTLIHPTHCSLCGWKREKPQDTGPGKDYRCSFEHEGFRCPLPGTQSNSTAPRKKWECIYHAKAKTYREKIEILEDIKANGAPRPVARETDALIDEMMKDPEMIKWPGESRRDYIQRCKRKAADRMEEIAARQRVNEDPDAIEERKAIQEYG